MSTSPFPDPFQLWREALTKLEGNVNALVTGSMDSQDMMRSVHQLSALSLGMQQAFEKAIGAYFAKLNLPSRKDVTELAATLQRVEDKLDRLLPASASAAASASASAAPPRPARTRRPPIAVAAPPPDAPSAAPPPRKSAKPKTARPRRRS
jgi:hypothetical protein